MEASGVAMAVPALVALTFQSFQRISIIYQNTKNAEKRLLDIIRDITTTEKTFRYVIRQLLTGVTDSDIRDRLMATPSQQYWSQHSTLEDELRASLGSLYPIVGDHVRNIHDSLEEFVKHLPEDRKVGLEAVTSSSGRIRTSPLQSLAMAGFSFASHGGESSLVHVGFIPWSRRVRSAVGKKIPELERIHRRMKDQNDALYQLCVMQYLPQIRDQPSQLRKTSTITAQSASSSQTLDRNSAVQQASIRLYRSLATYPNCSCHSPYLSLDAHSVMSGSNPASSAVVSFSLLLSAPREPIFLDVATSGPNPGTVTAQIQGGICVSLKAHSSTANPALLLDTFVLKAIQNTRPSFATNGVQLHQICRWSQEEFDQYNRFCVASHLGRAAQDFHKSPWFPLWNPTTIQFFKDLEKFPTPASWTPHLDLLAMAQNNNTAASPDTCKLDVLGRMLIELGGVDLESYAPMQADGGISKGLRALSGVAGIKYKRAVQQCFDIQASSPEETEKAIFEVLEQIAGLEAIAKEWYGEPDAV